MSRGRLERVVAESAEARALLRDDMPEAVKQAVLLASTGRMRHGMRKRCLMCQGKGLHSSVWIPPAALRIDTPDLVGVRAYWLCGDCQPTDEQVETALKQR